MPVHHLTSASPARVPDCSFAAAHLGELTAVIPPGLVDMALSQTRSMQKRVRLLPSRVVVYFLLAACLFPEIGYRLVWAKLTANLSHTRMVRPTPGALAQARRRIGPAPLHRLFDLLRGTARADPGRTGVWWHDLLVCAIDGTILTVPDNEQVRSRYVKQAGNHGGTGYPQVRLLALVACGTRAIIDAVFAPTTTGETSLAPGLFASLRFPMLVLADRNFDAQNIYAGIITAGADFLIRGKSRRKLLVLARHADGSFTSQIAGIPVRVIDAQMTITTIKGRQDHVYRLITSLTDPVRYPASDLVVLYHQRWEIETSFLELKSTLLGGRVLRSRTHQGVDQEIYALLCVYQAIRIMINDATRTTGADPDRGSFTIAVQTARDQVILAHHAITHNHADHTTRIGDHVLADLLPPRRLRACPRIVKRAISKYQARGPLIDRTCYTARLDIAILTSEPD